MGVDRRPVDQFHTANVANYSADRSKSKAISRSTSWFTDPETKRRKRVAKYKFVSMEGKAKQTVRNSFRWLKD
ncbi:hypothetical protein KC19_2G002000 [Ceratodon purpureus]|uniref:Uncharacterized protein n=1 Tax=Ceratodon purpureus TaxID=3225 RepID=A0A8T0IR45_CERPU|nr:hypothetical protein KC19_2G002000 [Ceratodon purpureus]